MTKSGRSKAQGREEAKRSKETSLFWVEEGLLFLIFFVGPQVFLPRHYDFANLPQIAFIHILATALMGVTVFLRRPLRLCWSWYYVPVLGFLIWATLSLTWAHNTYEGWSSLRMWQGPATLFLALVHMDMDEKRIKRILGYIFFSGVLSAIIGSLQYLVKFPFIPQVIGPAATFANKNMAAHIMVLTIPLGIAMGLFSTSLLTTAAYSLGTAVSLVFLYYTKTKAAWLAFLVEAIILTVAFLIMNRKKLLQIGIHRYKGLVVSSSLLFFLIAINLGPQGWQWAFLEIKQKAGLVTKAVEGEDKEAEEAAYASVGLRIAIYLNTLEMIKDRPILGYGVGNHKVFYPIYHRKAVVEKVFSEEAQLQNVHNDILQILSETGIIGIGLLAILFFMWLKHTYEISIKGNGSTLSRIICLAMFVAIIGIMINGSFCFPAYRAIPPTVVMAYTGIFAKVVGPKILLREIPKVFQFAILVLFVVFLGFLSYKYSVLIKSDKLYLMTSVNETKGRWKEVIKYANEAIKLEPNRAKIRSYLGRAYIETGECKKGVEELKKVVEAYPYHMNALLNMGVGYSCVSDFDNAIKIYNKVLEIKPDYAKVYNNIGHVYIKMRDYEKAAEILNQGNNMVPNDPIILSNLGYVYLLMRKLDEAKVVLEKAAAINPKDAFVRRNLGSVYWDLGMLEKAVRELEAALKLNPKIPGAEQIKNVLKEYREKRGGN